MSASNRRTAHLVVLCLLLTASLTANFMLYPLAMRAMPSEGAQPVIERTIALHARGSETAAATIRRETYPIVTDVIGMTCVELRAKDDSGNYGACYGRDGRLEGESAGVSH